MNPLQMEFGGPLRAPVSVLAALLTAGVVGASAQEAADGTRMALATPMARAVPPVGSAAVAAARVVLARHDFEKAFAMPTGRSLRLVAQGELLVANYGKRVVRSLRHDGRGSFVSADGALVVQFALDAHGEPETVHLTAPADWL